MNYEARTQMDFMNKGCYKVMLEWDMELMTVVKVSYGYKCFQIVSVSGISRHFIVRDYIGYTNRT